MAKYSKKQAEWTKQYNERAYDEIKIRVPKGMKDKYKELANQNAVSLNKMVANFLDAEYKKSLTE